MRIPTALAAALALALSAASPAAFAADAPGAQVLNGRQQFVDLDGQPIVGGKVYVYQAGTTTPVTTYQDPSLGNGSQNPFPVVLDGRGQATIWALPGTYREQVVDAQGDLIWDATTMAIGSTVAALSPGAAIGAAGDVSCPAQTFTGAAAVTLTCTLAPVGNGKLAAAPSPSLKGNKGAGNADLAPSDVVPLLAASNAQAAAGASSTTVLTPANFVGAGQAQGVSCGANCTGGYATLPGGVILQWGHYDCGSAGCYGGGVVAVAFPLSFPNGCSSIQATTDNAGLTSSPAYAMQTASACSAAGVSLSTAGYQSAGRGGIEGFYWFAVGR